MPTWLSLRRSGRPGSASLLLCRRSTAFLWWAGLLAVRPPLLYITAGYIIETHAIICVGIVTQEVIAKVRPRSDGNVGILAFVTETPIFVK